MYWIVFARTSAPCRIDVAGIPCVMSMISASGAIRLITPWQVPTKSSWSPKSLRNVTNIRRRLTRGAQDGGGEAVRILGVCLGGDVEARVAGGACRLGADRDDRRRRGVAGERAGGGR